MKKILFITAIAFSSLVQAAPEWEIKETSDHYGTTNKVVLKSADGENEFYIFRKPPKASIDRYDKERVHFGFKTNSLDQINRRSAVLYKASKGRPLSLGSSSRISGFDNVIETVAYHGQPEKNCGILSNILNSEKLTVRYYTTGQSTRDVTFSLPVDNSKVYDVLGFKKGTDCIEIFD